MFGRLGWVVLSGGFVVLEYGYSLCCGLFVGVVLLGWLRLIDGFVAGC